MQVCSMKYMAAIVMLLVAWQAHCADAWFGGDGGTKILLKDVQVLTLNSGKMTKGRRSSAVPQLECVNGGSASCGTFKPRVVQCTNRGFDGVEVQWECKTDMDNNLRFGSIDVSCEGYEYPDDPYILAGSCGLRYNLDFTREGGQHQHDYGYGNDYNSDRGSSYGWNDDVTSSKKRGYFSSIADLIVYCALGLMAWAFYKTCINPSHGTRNVGDRSDSTTNDDYPAGGGGGGGVGWNLGGGGGGGHGGTNRGSGFTPGADASCHNQHGQAGAAGAGGGGFWTGAAAGGLLGYMMGGNRGHNRAQGGGGWFSGGGYNRGGGGWGGGGGGWGGGGGGGFRSFGGSSGTRTASGFGGTSRR
uniref:Store-operated calcium entry-associated regulatory factor n=1 Tax=Hirondellea gigas TaxID=1518452 RepID=A0A2P2HVV9_9CRUS